jgi:hypothetical protein
MIGYYLHNPAWLIGFPIAIFALMCAVAFVGSILAALFGVGGRKGTPEEFADALDSQEFRVITVLHRSHGTRSHCA